MYIIPSNIERGSFRMTVFHVKGQKPYCVNTIEKIRTPRLLVFQDRVHRNIGKMRQVLEEIVPGSGFHHLSPHLKTNKSSLIMRWMLDAGISSFKTCINEAEMAAESGAKDIFIAYPLLAADAVHIAALASEYPDVVFSVQIGSLPHAHILRDAAVQCKTKWRFFIDVDVGMHRTGILPQEVFTLYSEVSQWPAFDFMGLHGYDGHIHHAGEQDRLNHARKSMQALLRVVAAFKRNTVTVPRIMVAGSLTFNLDLAYLYPRIGEQTLLQVSPGTWIYWDSEYDRLMPDVFEPAALILAQVIHVGGKNRITLNLGHKRWGADRGPVDCFSHPDLRVVSFNEEHTVLQHEGHNTFQIGDYVLIVPKHVCSTVNLYSYFTVIGENGKIAQLKEPVNGRNK
jgi:D-serine deaminase-like pyridoxal phosphate-dependent protein